MFHAHFTKILCIKKTAARIFFDYMGGCCFSVVHKILISYRIITQFLRILLLYSTQFLHIQKQYGTQFLRILYYVDTQFVC